MYLVYPAGLIIQQIPFSLGSCSSCVADYYGELTTCLNENKMIYYLFSEWIISSYIKNEIACNLVNIFTCPFFICFFFNNKICITSSIRVFFGSSDHFYLSIFLNWTLSSVHLLSIEHFNLKYYNFQIDHCGLRNKKNIITFFLEIWAHGLGGKL